MSFNQRFFNGLTIWLLALALAGCATPKPRALWTPFQHTPALRQVAAQYYEGCVCDDKTTFKKHNCTHYLSNAFINAGYTDILKSPHFTVRCSAGRPVRAQEFLKWAQENAEEFNNGIPPKGSGYWVGYQEKDGGRHHVFILDADSGGHYGTANCAKWPIQWFYQW